VGRSIIMKSAAIFAMASLTLGSPAAAAARTAVPVQASVISPWVALSALQSSASSTALCAASAAATAAQGAAPGCVLPQVDPAVAPPVAESPVVPAAPPAVAAGGIGALPLLLGLAGAAVIAALLLSGGGDGDDDIDLEEPVTTL
jgi:hypothetical protein